MKIWNISKSVTYFLLAIAIFVFSGDIMPYVGYLVGGIVCLYSTEEIVLSIIKKRYFDGEFRLFDGITQAFIGIILFIVAQDVVKVCLVWGVWGIIRETKDMEKAIQSLSEKKFALISIAESVIIIALSVLLIIEPNEEHAHFHVILLGIELLTVIVFSFAEDLYKKSAEKRKKLNSTDEKEEDFNQIS